MKKWIPAGLLIWTAMALSAQSEPAPVAAYREAAHSKNIDRYMEIFSDDIVIEDVGRIFDSPEEVRRWADREVIPQGDTFAFTETAASFEGYWKTRVRWYRWDVLYYFWTDETGKIRKMNLQYENVGTTESSWVYDRLPAAVALYFDAVKAGSDGLLEECFAPNPELQVVGRRFEDLEGIRRFAQTEVYGGSYELVELIRSDSDEVVIHLRFTPKSWSRPEPDAIYTFEMEGDRIRSMNLQYK